MLGVIGGLGPYASSYFYKRLLDKTKANCDQDYIDMIILNHSSIPDRTNYLIGKASDSPYEYLKKDIINLENLGASSILILCNTAHSFYDELSKTTKVPIRNLVQDTAKYSSDKNIKRVTLLATTGTLESNIYQKYCSKYDIECKNLDDKHQEILMNLIYKYIKLGKKIDTNLWNSIIQSSDDNPILLGCTELSILKTDLNLDDRFIDPIEIQIDSILEEQSNAKKLILR